MAFIRLKHRISLLLGFGVTYTYSPILIDLLAKKRGRQNLAVTSLFL